MKMFRLGSFIFLISLLSWSCVASVWASDQWPKKRGELCWDNNIGSGGTRTLLITNMGNGHYSLHGRYTPKEGQVRPVVGSAEIVDDSIFMILTSAGKNNAGLLVTSTLYVVLDKSTLNGTSEIINHGYTGSEISQTYATGTETLVSCKK